MDKMKVISHILLLFDVKHMLFFRRGQLSNLDKLGKIAKVNMRKGLVVFHSLPFSFLRSHLQTLFGLVNPLPGFSVTVIVRPKRLRRGYRRAAFYCFTAPKSTSKRE